MTEWQDMPEAPSTWRCDNCEEVCSQPLKAASPFDKNEVIFGCPHCRGIGTLEQGCQHLGCTMPVSSGTPGGNGYRYFWSCTEHSPSPPTSGDE